MACSVKKNRVLNTGCDLLKDVQNNIPILFYGIVLIDGDFLKVLGKTLYVIFFCMKFIKNVKSKDVRKST